MNWKLIWRGLQKKQLRDKLLVVFGLLLVYRLLSHIPIPLAEPTELKQLIDNLLSDEGVPQLLRLFNVLTGGALGSLSIMLVGLGPYINASIIMQVLARAIPKLETLQKEGEYGRKKINQYTRLLTLPFAIIQSFLVLFIVRQLASQVSGLGDILAGATVLDWTVMIAALTTGAMILMWLGELITEKGIGNGISLLITVAIVSQLPFMATSLYNAIVTSTADFSFFGWFTLPVNGQALLYGAILTVATFLITIFVVYLNEAHRKIKLSYAKRTQGNRQYSDVTTHLPIKLIAAGVVPIIFALAFLSVPQLIGQWLSGVESVGWSAFGENLLIWFATPGSTGGPVFSNFVSFIYPTSYLLLVIAFTYFYTNVIFSAKDISERLQRQGGYIEGVRPGAETQKYLSQIVSRLNFFGSLSLGFLALTPILAQAFLGTDQLALGGTSILILVAVALETLRQIESQALVVTYEDYEHNLVQQKAQKKNKRRFRKNP